jgi:hypothetical protein
MKPIPGFDGYFAESDGRIFSGPKSPIHGKNHSGMYLTQGRHTKGYMCVKIRTNNISKTQFVHRLVALAWIQNPEGKKQVNHINGEKSDNRVENLEWCTAQENIRHAIETGATNTRAPNKLAAAARNAVLARASLKNIRDNRP